MEQQKDTPLELFTMEGQVFNGYCVGDVIGIGTYGEVRFATRVDTNELVALKVVDLTRFEEDAAALIIKEIRILETLEHKHCIRMIDLQERVACNGQWCDVCACSRYEESEEDADAPEDQRACRFCSHYGHEHSHEQSRRVMFIVQELCAGGELFGLLMHSGCFPEDIARYYFKQLISGLEYLHGKGIVHRDLKPENLVLDADFNLKIVDFGLAAISDGVENTRGVFHSGVGSQPYSAPEVYYTKELFDDVGYKGRPADLWSCAVILYVMLIGRPPFLRPLTKTYGPDMRRCKHFQNLMKGHGYESMSTTAANLLQKMFMINPNKRLSIDQIKAHPWMQEEVPAYETIAKMMDEKANEVWKSQGKDAMVGILKRMREDGCGRDALDVSMNAMMDESLDEELGMPHAVKSMFGNERGGNDVDSDFEDRERMDFDTSNVNMMASPSGKGNPFQRNGATNNVNTNSSSSSSKASTTKTTGGGFLPFSPYSPLQQHPFLENYNSSFIPQDNSLQHSWIPTQPIDMNRDIERVPPSTSLSASVTDFPSALLQQGGVSSITPNSQSQGSLIHSLMANQSSNRSRSNSFQPSMSNSNGQLLVPSSRNTPQFVKLGSTPPQHPPVVFTMKNNSSPTVQPSPFAKAYSSGSLSSASMANLSIQEKGDSIPNEEEKMI